MSYAPCSSGLLQCACSVHSAYGEQCPLFLWVTPGKISTTCRKAAIVPDSHLDQNQREKIVALEYDNLLLRRNAFKAARHTKVAIAVSSLAGTLYTTQRVSLALAWGRWCSIDPSSIRLSMDAVIGDVQPETTCRPTLPRKDSTGSVMSLSHDTELLWPPLQPKSKSVSSGTSHGSRSSIAPNRHQQSGGTSSRTLRWTCTAPQLMLARSRRAHFSECNTPEHPSNTLALPCDSIRDEGYNAKTNKENDLTFSPDTRPWTRYFLSRSKLHTLPDRGPSSIYSKS
eukprot:scaffold200563_cov39-Tisochrysis_lutea.AAC.2